MNKYRWVICKNNFKVGQSTTWHGALDILIKQDQLTDVRLEIYTGLVQVFDTKEDVGDYYKITKEFII